MSVTHEKPGDLGLRWAPYVFLVLGIFFTAEALYMFASVQCADVNVLIPDPTDQFVFKGTLLSHVYPVNLLRISDVAWLGLGLMVMSCLIGIRRWFNDLLAAAGSRSTTFTRATLYVGVFALMIVGTAYFVARILDCG